MDEFDTSYFYGFYGIPFSTVHNPPEPISIETLDPHQIEALLQQHLQCNPMESAVRVRSWLESQIGAPGRLITGQEYFLSANCLLAAEIDGDLFIRSEAL
jgi:hypothetical protein